MELLNQNTVLEAFHFDNLEDLFVGMCNRNPQPSAVIDFLKIKKKFVLNLTKKSNEPSNVPVIVPNAGKVAVTLGSCCTPIPGDDIVGFITKGKGITIHRLNCPNIRSESERLTEVHWNDNLELATYPVDLNLTCGDRVNLLVDVMTALTSQKVAVTSINAKLHTQTAQTTIAATILVSDAKRLNDIINILLNVTGVYEVHRLIH
jgi:GTP pyrophosphokinase